MRLGAILVIVMQAQQINPRAFVVTQERHKSFSESSIIEMNTPVNGPALPTLLRVARNNHLPLGIVLESSPDQGICDGSLKLVSGEVTISELLSKVNAAMPRYHAHLQGGMIYVRPIDIPQAAGQLLSFKLNRFDQPPETHAQLGANLWMNIRLTIAPNEAASGSGFGSTMAEKVPAISMTDSSVETILDRIVDQGDGAMWVLYSGHIKSLASTVLRPFDIYGYVGPDGFTALTKMCKQ